MDGHEQGSGSRPRVLDLCAGRAGDQGVLDGAVVRRQGLALLPGVGGTRFQQRITGLIGARRRGGGDHLEHFDVVDDASPGGTAVVRGALLVRSSLATADPALLGELVDRVGAAQARLDGRLLVLSGRDLAPDELVTLARGVRARGHEASVAHIVPLNIVCKGEGGPARTSLKVQVADPQPAAGAVRVALIDTGVAVAGREHDWQRPLRSVDNIDLLDAFPAPGGDGMLDAAAGHGAFTTGVVQQVDPAGSVAVHRALDSDGIGSEVRVAELLLHAIREQGAEVVNLSLGTQTLDDQPLLALEVAFELLGEGGYDDVLLVAAAGNYGSTRPCWPAASRRVVAVAALTAAMEPAPWSSRGWWVDVSTVGEGLVSTYVRGRESPELSPSQGPDEWPMDDSRPWAVWTGTSFAAPQVAAEVARRLTAERAAGNPAATARDVLRGLLAEGRRLPDYGVAVKILSGTPVTG